MTEPTEAAFLPAPGPEYLPRTAERRAVERVVTDRLLLTGPPSVSPAVVRRTVHAAAQELRDSGVVHGLEPALEAMALQRLNPELRAG